MNTGTMNHSISWMVRGAGKYELLVDGELRGVMFQHGIQYVDEKGGALDRDFDRARHMLEERIASSEPA